MVAIWLYTLTSVFLVSLVSLVGIVAFVGNGKKIEKYLIYVVSLSAGTLLGNAFMHLIPESYESFSNFHVASILVLTGIFFFFSMEKLIHWRHCHAIACEKHPHPFSYMILVGDSVHNFIDGMIIGASFLISVPLGIATTLAVILHEIPQEIGDFGSLLYGGFSKKKALVYNFLTALTAVLGAIIILALSQAGAFLSQILIPLAAGGFIYISASDLIPELRKENEIKKTLVQGACFLAGIILMLLLAVSKI